MKIRTLTVSPSRRLEDLVLVEKPAQQVLLEGQIRVQMEALGLNFRDLLVATAYERWASPEGRVLGSDGVGIVSELGPGVTRFNVGDRVLTTFLPNWREGDLTAEKSTGALGGPSAEGVFAEQVVLQASGAVLAPDYLSPVEAATLPVAALTAWHALKRADVMRKGAKVLIEGSGGVSVFAMQMALSAGATVFAVGRSDKKLERLKMLGAAATLNSSTTPDWGSRIFDMADGKGVDAVIDIGGASTLNQAIEATAFGGTVSVVGLAGGLQVEMNLADIFRKNIRLDGIETGSRTMLEEMIRWFEQHQIRPIIDSTFSFEKSRDAFLHLQEANHFGKIGIELGPRV
ncbi:NAD(P)-dependent alcohol dehydrogenase [Granulicella sp. S190]|uniref:zinc-dependent alcohol dehydrogenase family protein n=1 Tax=Granulicella sp. S190 TaxID=1747226 RepID=UPI00131B7F68|nr:NAD(P)-dependent alcohol dehydrogenase [Granulicella sp. S190]